MKCRYMEMIDRIDEKESSVCGCMLHEVDAGAFWADLCAPRGPQGPPKGARSIVPLPQARCVPAAQRKW